MMALQTNTSMIRQLLKYCPVTSPGDCRNKHVYTLYNMYY